MSNAATSDDLKKKRGRKKKVDATPADDIIVNPEAAPPPAADPDSKQPPKSRRGRKNKSVVKNAYTSEKDGPSMSDDENVIVKLQIRTPEKADSNLSPNAYNAHANSSFESVPLHLNPEEKQPASDTSYQPVEAVEDQSEAKIVHSNLSGGSKDDLKIVELLKDFEMKSKVHEWPQTTSIACYWCCNQFITVPYGIPVKYHNGKFHVYGCFCSLECAAAYNFSSLESSDEVWERYNLINLLSRRLSYKPIVKPAPSRLALKMFGGHMDIDAFRDNCNTKKLLSVNFPPMMTLTQQIEEINECDINSEYRYIPIDQDRINRYKEKLTLKRSKPLTEYKHTLDHMMNLKIN